MIKLYVLDHIHQFSNREMDIKGIGIFLQKSKIIDVLSKYKNLPGFKDYPNGFVITEYILDRVNMEILKELIRKKIDKVKHEIKLKIWTKPTITTLYSLYYIYENFEGYESIKLFGLFSSNQNATTVLEYYKKNQNLKDISKYLVIDSTESVDLLDWSEGFVTID